MTFPATTTQLYDSLKISAEFILKRLPPADTSIILGNGLTHFYQQLENPQSIDYQEIPYLPVPTVQEHKGTLYYGKVDNKHIYCWAGRLHGYEGYQHYEIAYIAHLCAFLGCNTLLITNASGTSMEGAKPGDIVFAQDYIKHYGENPLDTGLHSHFTKTFESYSIDPALIDYAMEIGKRLPTIKCHKGTYFWVRGPSFETTFETECFTALGGDFFGMSTVPELMASQAHGMRVLVAGVVTHITSGLSRSQILTSERINEQIERVQGEIEELFIGILSELPPFEGKILTE